MLQYTLHLSLLLNKLIVKYSKCKLVKVVTYQYVISNFR